MPQNHLKSVFVLPLVFVVTFSGAGVALAEPPVVNSAPQLIETGGVSTDYIRTPDGIATVVEDFGNGTITVIDENGQKAVFDRAEILALADRVSIKGDDGRLARTASVDEGTRVYLCNLFAGVAAGAQSWAWQTALAIAKVHPGVRIVVAGGQIAFWAFITTQC